MDKYLDIDFSAKELVEENKKSKPKNISYQELKAVGEDFVHRFYYYQEIIEKLADGEMHLEDLGNIEEFIDDD